MKEEGAVRATPLATRTFSAGKCRKPTPLAHTRQHRELTETTAPKTAIPFPHAHTRELIARHKSVDLGANDVVLAPG